jgi:serine/threonine protein kinase
MNVFVDDQHRAVLADFGLSIVGDSSRDAMTATGTGAGSIRWMSPERFAEICPRRSRANDVYAFGCLCYLVSLECTSSTHLGDVHPRCLLASCHSTTAIAMRSRRKLWTESVLRARPSPPVGYPCLTKCGPLSRTAGHTNPPHGHPSPSFALGLKPPLRD